MGFAIETQTISKKKKAACFLASRLEPSEPVLSAGRLQSRPNRLGELLEENCCGLLGIRLYNPEHPQRWVVGKTFSSSLETIPNIQVP